VIAKIGRGSSFRGALNYVLHREHQPQIIGGNMAATNARDLAREFGMSRQLRPEVEQPVEHVSFSWGPSERVTQDQMREAVQRWLERMGFDLAANQFRVIQHRDRPHPHCHVIVSRIRMDNRRLVPQPWREYTRNKEVCRAIEKEMGFQRVPDRRRLQGHEWHPTRGEERMLRDRGLASEKEQIKYVIRQAAQGRPTMTEFLGRIREQGLSARPNIARNGRVSGISYRLDQVAVKGSQLGRSFTWTGLQRSLGVRYDRQRDAAALEVARRATIGRDVEPRRGRGRRPVVAALRGLSTIRDIVRNPLRAAVTKLLPGVQPVLKAADALRLGGNLVTSPTPTVARMVAGAVLDKLAQREPHTCRGLTPVTKRPPEN